MLVCAMQIQINRLMLIIKRVTPYVSMCVDCPAHNTDTWSLTYYSDKTACDLEFDLKYQQYLPLYTWYTLHIVFKWYRSHKYYHNPVYSWSSLQTVRLRYENIVTCYFDFGILMSASLDQRNCLLSPLRSGSVLHVYTRGVFQDFYNRKILKFDDKTRSWPPWPPLDPPVVIHVSLYIR